MFYNYMFIKAGLYCLPNKESPVMGNITAQDTDTV